MKETPTDFQQQVLFDEPKLNESDITDNVPEQQLIVSNLDWQATETEVEQVLERELTDAKPHWLRRIIAALLGTALVIELVQYFQNGFIEQPFITSIYAALVALLGVLVTTRAVKEWRNLRAFTKQNEKRVLATELIEQGTPLNVSSFCEDITASLPCDLFDDKNNPWSVVAHQEYNDIELLQLYDKMVLSHVDNKAIAEIAKFSTESVVLIALSPVALVDMMIMFWRNMRMIDKIAGLYGLRLGYWSRIKLIKQVFVNLVYAGGSELIADLGTDLIGADMLGKFSARLAQGAGAGMLTARLGLKTMALCRPLPFQQSAPKMVEIRKEILQQIKKLVLKK